MTAGARVSRVRRSVSVVTELIDGFLAQTGLTVDPLPP
jgi:hypothetical protein